MPNESLVDKLGKLLWQVLPHEAKLIQFRGQFYEEHFQCGFEWFNEKSVRLGPVKYDDRLMAARSDAANLVISLQRTPPFANEPFTHMRFAMDDEGKTQVEFAYIPEWDSWPGLFMSGVSEVPEDEAKKRSRFYETWKECRARFAREPYQK